MSAASSACAISLVRLPGASSLRAAANSFSAHPLTTELAVGRRIQQPGKAKPLLDIACELDIR